MAEEKKVTKKRKRDQSHRHRNWCLTWQLPFNLEDHHLESFSEVCEGTCLKMADDSRIKAFICQIEAAPETGKHHMQAFAMFNSLVGMSYCREWFQDHWSADAKPHMEPSRAGHPKQAWDYCAKDETRVLGGTPPTSLRWRLFNLFLWR